MELGTEPIADDEIIYRRIPAAANPRQYDGTTGKPSYIAFAPHKTRDVTGVSVSRAKYKSIQEAAVGQPGKTYYVAVLSAKKLREAGVIITPRPLPEKNDPGHAELPQLNAAAYKDDKTIRLQMKLAQLCERVEGPFSTDVEA